VLSIDKGREGVSKNKYRDKSHSSDLLDGKVHFRNHLYG